jgi:hypothetical protein
VFRISSIGQEPILYAIMPALPLKANVERRQARTDSAKVSLRTCGRADEGDYRDVQTETARGVTIAPAPGIDGSLC